LQKPKTFLAIHESKYMSDDGTGGLTHNIPATGIHAQVWKVGT